MAELGAAEKAPPEEVEALEMAEMLVEPMVLVCCTDSIESTAFLRTTHLYSTRNSAAPPPAPPWSASSIGSSGLRRGGGLFCVRWSCVLGALEPRRLRPEWRWRAPGSERAARPLAPGRNFARSREARASGEPGAARHSGFLGTGSPPRRGVDISA